MSLSCGSQTGIISALATWFHADFATVRPNVPEKIVEWGTVHILPDGDTIHAASLYWAQKDTQDATFVQVSVLNMLHILTYQFPFP